MPSKAFLATIHWTSCSMTSPVLGQIILPGARAVRRRGGIARPLLLDDSRIVDLSRCSRPLSHICNSGLGRLTSMECPLRLSFVEPVRVVHVNEVQLFEFGRGKRRSVE